eukprot:TRINITY_DN72_c0_g2_i1.p1 TRINITY_DN72_c0_g2~~TRINITY_DN72_c0_g2_i1.p1  ORF type:complete len:323 (+),score=58.97 TRINITY_DN72_c0_g2_i1:13-981(+)
MQWAASSFTEVGTSSAFSSSLGLKPFLRYPSADRGGCLHFTMAAATMEFTAIAHLSSSPSSASNVQRTQPSASVCQTQSCRSTRSIRLASSFAGRPVRGNVGCVSPSSTSQCHQRHQTLRIEAARKVVTGRSYVLSSTLVAEEGKVEEVMKLCKGILAWADERKKDTKLGVLHFECNTDAFDANVIHFWERYNTFPSMNDTRASPEHCQFMDEVRPLLVEPVALAAYEYKDGQLGCMLNPIGPKGEGGLDDATGGSGGSGGGATLKQTSSGLKQGLSDEEEEEGRGMWGLSNALDVSTARQATVEAASKIAEGLANLFGQKK